MISLHATTGQHVRKSRGTLAMIHDLSILEIYGEPSLESWTNSLGSMTPHRRGLSRRALRQALTYIETHLGDPVRLQDLAQAAGVSRFHFARLFRISTGESPMEFLLRTRIERAKMILRSTDRRMCEIAASLGFCDQSHFSRSFRRYAGMTPRQFAHQFLTGAAQRPASMGECRVEL
jgi:transcriptional regulator GlxA family with amidase domain